MSKHNFMQLTVPFLLFWIAGIPTATAQNESSTPAFRKDWKHIGLIPFLTP